MPGIGKYVSLGTAGTILISNIALSAPGEYITIGDRYDAEPTEQVSGDPRSMTDDAGLIDFHSAAMQQGSKDTIVIGDYKVLKTQIKYLQDILAAENNEIVVLSFREDRNDFLFYSPPSYKPCEKYEEFIDILEKIESRYRRKHKKDEGFEDNIDLIITDQELQEYYFNALKKKIF